MAAQVDHRGSRQAAALGQMIIEKEARADHPHRPQMRIVRHDEAQGPHDMRRSAEQQFTLL